MLRVEGEGGQTCSAEARVAVDRDTLLLIAHVQEPGVAPRLLDCVHSTWLTFSKHTHLDRRHTPLDRTRPETCCPNLSNDQDNGSKRHLTTWLQVSYHDYLTVSVDRDTLLFNAYVQEPVVSPRLNRCTSLIRNSPTP